jgi:hypothetical protein
MKLTKGATVQTKEITAAKAVYTKNFTQQRKTGYTPCNRVSSTPCFPTQPKEIRHTMFLEHLVTAKAADFVPDIMPGDSDFAPLSEATPAQTLSAQHKTSQWLKSLTDEDDEILTEAQEEKTTSAFNALVTHDPKAKEKLLQLDLPEEIKSAVGMVTAYQWKFIEQAEELRSMAVSHIVKEIQHPDARIRLKALEMLGKVTEVALFTDRVTVKNEEISDEELDARIKEKLGRYMGAVDIVDVEEKE